MKTIQIFFILVASMLHASSSLIVYNSNIGLVHEEKKLTLKRNDTEIVYAGVANSIDIDSVNVQLPQGVKLYSQQYRYDKLTQQKLLEKQLGKKVFFQGAKVTLLSYFAKEALVKTAKNRIITIKTQDIAFESIPKSLLTKPSLVWNIATSKSINASMQLDYIMKNISWSSNYILNLDGDTADLTAWISINNHTGKAFKETTLYVVAGDINRVNTYQNRPQIREMKAMMVDASNVKEEAHEGYHLYTIPFQVTLANNEKTEIKFLHKEALQIQREYSAFLSNPLYLRGKKRSNVVQYLRLQGIDSPLPQGIVRTYSKLHNTSILLGESKIAHTPKNEPIKLKIGRNFDVTVVQKELQRDDTKYRYRTTIQYTLKNASDTQKSVTLRIPFNTRADSIIETKEKYTFTQGNLVTFRVNIAPQSQKQFNVYYETKK